MSTPKVSILISLRNEIHTIDRLLSGLIALQYPVKNLEILIADDDSDDGTTEILRTIAQKHSHIQVFQIPKKEDWELQQGKMRALSYLEAFATGEYFFYTDGDILLPPNWIQNTLPFFKDTIGIVVGCTAIENSSLMAGFQNIEWLTALKYMHDMYKKGKFTTGMGNNMAISKVALERIGGFRNLTFSIVEDYAVYCKIVEQGFGFAHIYDKNNCAYTLPADHFWQQRKRWLRGALNSHVSMKYVHVANGCFIPFCGTLAYFYPIIGVLLAILYLLIQWSLTGSVQSSFKKPLGMLSILLYPFYSSGYSFILLLLYGLSPKIDWKKRKYA
ncbi:MAG: glycosyltransferase [Leadbetterella sp.]